ncbi:hypothetical protein N9E05_00195 [Gammaproteobacteria bacterium]|jgi:hypothetical protein|nr:hypothetical protein [Gammaproteobacteria bacterium]MDA9954693.1 hypothetical protein [Gammaproteobacteria bacterium]MDB9934168.1 hypothetical protein [Gammaproteobacteria bacterium]
MKLFMVHVGFYDAEVGEGIYESHMNFFIAASNAKSAKKKTFNLEQFKNKKMHIDGIKEISDVEGYKVILEKSSYKNKSKVYSYNESKKL